MDPAIESLSTDWEDLLQRVMELSVREAEEKEPYKHMYEAREELISFRSRISSMIEAASAEDEVLFLEDRLALCDVVIGSNYVKTEEISAGETSLTRSLRHFCGDAVLDEGCDVASFDFSSTPCASKYPAEVAKCMSELGVVWANRGDAEKALLFLKLCEEYLNFLKRECADSDIVVKSKASLSSIKTYTLFFQAQVYGTMGKLEESANCCKYTLLRQLKIDYDPVFWCSNAMGIVKYSQRIGDHLSCVVWLQAAGAVLEKMPPPREDSDEYEPYAVAGAKHCKEWGKYYVSILREAYNRVIRGQLTPNLAPAEEEEEATPPAEVPAIISKLRAMLDLKEIKILRPEQVWKFDHARDLFLGGMRWIERGLKWFVLDGFVTEHTKLKQNVNRLYKYLAAFESAPTRILAMQTRRIKALKPVLNALSPVHFTVLVKELSFELGSVYNELVTVRSVLLEQSMQASPTAEQAKEFAQGFKKLVGYVQQGIAHFQTFIDSFKKEDKDPETIDADSVEVYLTAHFQIARLYSRFPLSGAAKVQALRSSLAKYTWIVENAPKLLPKENPEGVFKEEIELCREMKALLPSRIDQLLAISGP